MHGSCSPNQRFGQLLRRCLRNEADELYRLFERSESHSFTLVIRTKVKSGFLPSVGQLIQFLSHRSVTAPFPKRSLGNRLLIFYSILFRQTEAPFRVERRLVFYLVEIAMEGKNPPALCATSPVYGFCDPNRRFGQNLTLGKGGLYNGY